VLKLFIENNRECNIETHLAFVDIRKAFDTVDRIKLVDVIKIDGTSNQLITAIFYIYKDNYIAIGGEDKQTEWILINQGVRQGCSLSALLFIIYINSLLNEWKQTNHGKVFMSRNLNLNILLFADDVILFANSEDDLQHSICKFQLIAEKFSMKISIDKSRAISFKGKEHIRSKICVYDKPVEQVSSFKHLGYNISYEKDINISMKILNYNRAMGIINQIFKPSLVQTCTRISL
jgi:hypothetical protein